MRFLVRELYISLAVWLLLAVMLPSLLFMSLPGFQPSFAVGLAGLLVIYSASRLAYLAAKGRMRVISISFWIYVYIWLGLCPLLQLGVNLFPWTGEYDAGEQFIGMVIIWVGVLGFELGGWLVTRGTSGLSYPLRKLAERRVSTARAVTLAIIGSVISIAIVQLLGGVSNLFIARNARVDLALTTGGGLAGGSMLLTIMRVPPAVSSLLLIYLLRNPEEERRHLARIGLIALATLVVVINLVINNPVATARWWFGTVVIGMATLLFRWRGRLSSVTWVLGFVAGLLLLFPIADVFRYSAKADLKLTSVSLVAPELVQNGDFSSFQQVLNAAEYVEAQGNAFGRQAASAVLVFVPRSVWDGKSVHTGELVARARGYNWTNLEMPLWGEGYVDFGILGVAMYLLVFGIGSASIERSALRNLASSQPIVFVIIAALAGFQLMLLRGSLAVALAFIYPLLAFILLPTVRGASQTALTPVVRAIPRPGFARNQALLPHRK